jgi:hypothetical protein
MGWYEPDKRMEPPFCEKEKQLVNDCGMEKGFVPF